MHKLEIDTDRCNGCRTCVDVCFVNAIVWDESKDLPVLKYADDCQICTVCERGCPTRAIEVVPDWPSRYCPRYLSVDVKRED